MRKEVGGEQAGFFTAGAGADLHDDVALVARVFWQQQQTQLRFQHLEAVLQRFALFGGEARSSASVSSSCMTRASASCSEQLRCSRATCTSSSRPARSFESGVRR